MPTALKDLCTNFEDSVRITPIMERLQMFEDGYWLVLKDGTATFSNGAYFLPADAERWQHAWRQDKLLLALPEWWFSLNSNDFTTKLREINKNEFEVLPAFRKQEHSYRLVTYCDEETGETKTRIPTRGFTGNITRAISHYKKIMPMLRGPEAIKACVELLVLLDENSLLETSAKGEEGE